MTNNNLTKEEIQIITGRVSKHGKGKVCDKCGKRKKTKKVGRRYLCDTCRKPRGRNDR